MVPAAVLSCGSLPQCHVLCIREGLRLQLERLWLAQGVARAGWEGARGGAEFAARSIDVQALQGVAQAGLEGGADLAARSIDGLIDQTRSIERAVVALDLGAIEIEGSDSLDSPDAVFQ